jgi:Tfp pilus assembly protein PilN
MIEINLLPGAKRKRSAKGAGIQLPDFKALAGLVKDPWLLAFIGSWLVFGLVFALLFLPRRAHVQELEPRLVRTNREAVRMRGVLAQMQRFQARRESLQTQIGVIRDIDRERYVWPHIMQAVTRALPQYTWLEEMNVRTGSEGDSASGTSFQLTGKSADIQAITRFVRNLEDSPFLSQVSPISSATTTDEGRDVHTYVVTALYSHPDTSLITMQPLSTTLVQGVRSGGGRRR